MSKILFEKDYDGESLYDLGRDISEATDENYNSALNDIPQDEYGFQKGKFTVTIKWSPEE